MLGLCLALGMIAGAGDEGPAAPVRALIVTGIDHPAHDWRATAPELKRLVEADGRAAAAIVTDPEALGDPGTLASIDVLIIHFANYEKPLTHTAEALANLKAFQARGGGLVLVHFASGAFPGEPAYGRMAGMVWDRKNTHDPRGVFAVEVVAPGHAVMRGIPAFDTDDELYIGLAEQRPVEVLAVARSKVTGRDHPMAFVFTEGGGRVFHTTLGHDVRALGTPEARRMIERAVVWTAGRER
jgi:type 1 glutamine amidotransferase